MAKNLNAGEVLGGLAVAGVIIWWLAGGTDPLTALGMKSVETHVADDEISQYEITKRSGNPIDICAQAGLVVAAYLQAKDESHYAQWKAIEKSDCAEAGVPQ